MQSMSACKYCNIREYSALIHTVLPYILPLIEYKFVGYKQWCKQQLNIHSIPGNIGIT
jgi:hypothetical protein